MGVEGSHVTAEPAADPVGHEDGPLADAQREMAEAQARAAQMQGLAAQMQFQADQAQTMAAEAQRRAGGGPQAGGGLLAPRQQQQWEMFPGPAILEELRQACDTGLVSFYQTYLAGMIGASPVGPESVTQDAREMEPKLIRHFQEHYGGILESRYAEVSAAATVLLRRVDEKDPPLPPGPAAPPADGADAGGRTSPLRAFWHWTRSAPMRTTRRMLTGSPERAGVEPRHTPRAGEMDAVVMWHWLRFDSPDATNLMSAILALRDRITTFLRGELPREKDARDIALRRLYGIARELVSALDWEGHLKRDVEGPTADRRPSRDLGLIIADLRARLASTEANYLAAVQRVAQNEYLIGMFTGLLLQTVLLIGFAIVTGVVGINAGWLAAAVGGVVGATLSVLQRLGRGLELGPEGEKQSFRQQGLARPVIGLLLGLVSYVLLRGGIVAFTTPRAAGSQVLYYGGIAFLAGFSERFAQDMLVAPARSGSAPATAGAAPGKPA